LAQGILPVQSKITNQHIQCPECPSSDAYCEYDDGHGYCYSCSYYKPKEGKGISEDVFTYEYLPYRGITKDTFEFYKTKTKIESDVPISIGFPYPNGSAKVRELPKGFRSIGDISKAGCFGRNLFAAGSHKWVIITEGELDALSYYQVVRCPTVSVRSSGSAKLDTAIDRSWLNSFERIYLAFDADGPGRDAARSVANHFDYNKVYDIRFPGGARKDANDYLRNGEADELRNLFQNAKRFLPDNIISSLADLKKELLKPVLKGVPWPFPTLTDMTYGLRPREVVLITAQEGVGKTEVTHTLLHNLLKETDDAVGAIFLEESKSRLLQAVAGIELKKPIHLPDCYCTDAEKESAIDRVVRTDDRLHVYSHFGSDDADAILDTIRFLVSARGCRWVIFDLISLAISGLGGDREEKALSYLSGRLALSTQELNYGLIMVSHVNDFGQTRGSRMIGKDCHIRVDLARDLKATDDRLRRTTEVMISKNRPASRTGPAGKLLFDPITYTLTEDFEHDLLQAA
jgi:twinkle protein